MFSKLLGTIGTPIYLALFLLSWNAFAADSDVPERGRSGFDHFIDAAGGVPFPIDSLTKRLREFHGLKVVKTIFPFSRSLQKNVVSLAAPRELYATELRSTPITDPATYLRELKALGMFVGYSREANTLEVISYNEAMARYEFQLVTSYGPGLVPKVSYAPRKLCVACHQGEGPIFPLGSWEESEKNRVNMNSLKEQGFFDGRDDVRVEIWHDEDGAAGFDRVVRESAEHAGMFFQKVWSSACGNTPAAKLECRRLLIEIAIRRLSGDRSGSDRDIVPLLQRLEFLLNENWPDAGIANYSSYIPNRDPYKFQPGDPLPRNLDPLTPRPARMFYFGHREGEGLTAHDAMVDLMSSADFLDKDGARILMAKAGSFARLRTMLASKDLLPVLSGDVLDRQAMYHALFLGLGANVPAIDLWEARESVMPKPHLESDARPVELAERELALPARRSDLSPSVLQKLRHYCQPCHQNGDGLPFNFMKGDDEAIFRNLSNSEVQKRVLERLLPEPDQRLMPPPRSVLGKEFRESENHRVEITLELQRWIQASRPFCVGALSDSQLESK